MPIDPTYKIINTRYGPGIKEVIIMTGITKNEYEKIKRSEDLYITRGNNKFRIMCDDIFCYGDIDFHDGSEDSEQLDTFNWLDDLGSKGINIPSKYDYETHTCIPFGKFITYTETFRPSTLCRYFHGCLGKPQYTLIFRELK